MYTKIEITGTIEVMTGMHIGDSSTFSAIGAVDSPVIKDVSGYPMIPGSSLKGKMRALLAKRYNQAVATTPEDDAKELVELFGSSRKDRMRVGRVLFSDMILSNWDELRKHGLNSKTEIKFENSIRRTTGIANPRQIERVVRGSKFPLNLIYEVDKEEKIVRDFEILVEGFRLLQYDYLGGNGSRGYGKVRFYDLQAEVVVGETEEAILSECQDLLEQI